jgi:hypothetical protein
VQADYIELKVVCKIRKRKGIRAAISLERARKSKRTRARAVRIAHREHHSRSRSDLLGALLAPEKVRRVIVVVQCTLVTAIKFDDRAYREVLTEHKQLLRTGARAGDRRLRDAAVSGNRKGAAENLDRVARLLADQDSHHPVSRRRIGNRPVDACD